MEGDWGRSFAWWGWLLLLHQSFGRSMLGNLCRVISTVQAHRKLSANTDYHYLLLKQITNVKNLINCGATDQWELPLILVIKKSPSYLAQVDHWALGKTCHSRSKFSALFPKYFRGDSLLTYSSYKSSLSTLRRSRNCYGTLYNWVELGKTMAQDLLLL